MAVNTINLTRPGILPVQMLRMLIGESVITAPDNYTIQDNQLQPNSIDLRLGEVAYRVRCSFLPDDESVKEKLDRLAQHSFSIVDGAVLEPNCTYIIPLLEEIHLPDFGELYQNGDGNNLHFREPLSARTNPKSSTGRLDIFTRVITDYSHRFEEISEGYSGKLYLEVVPKTFSIRVRTGHRLNQLRIRHGVAKLTDQDIAKVHQVDPVLFNDQHKPLATKDLKLQDGLFMSVSLRGGKNKIIGYKARKNRDLIDLDRVDYYNVADFWEPIFADRGDSVILEPEAFYIFSSKERCRIPAQLAAEMVPYDTGSGELRTHYAGFFDSGFGGSVEAGGARAVLEVRSHDVPFLIEDGQTFFRMVFEPNTETPEFIYGDEINSNYQGQDLKLGKHFKS